VTLKNIISPSKHDFNLNTKLMMRNIFWALFLSPILGWSQISPETVVDIVQKQLEAYNKRDLKTFTSLFHEDAILYNLGDTTPIASGLEAVTRLYERLFANSPNLRSDVISRQIIGNKVLDYEVITGRAGASEPIYLIAVYEIVDNKIKRCYFIRP
jgi:hypothetical protein